MKKVITAISFSAMLLISPQAIQSQGGGLTCQHQIEVCSAQIDRLRDISAMLWANAPSAVAARFEEFLQAKVIECGEKIEEACS